MKSLLLCDDSQAGLVAKKATRVKAGIEFQAFYKPSVCENNEEIVKHREIDNMVHPLSLHAPYADLCPGSSDPMVREVAMNRFNLGYSVAKNLGINSIVFHIGWIPGAGIPKNWIERCVAFWKEFIKNKDSNVQFYIENLFDNTTEVIKNVVLGIGDKRVKICLDIGHVNCYSSVDLINWIKDLGNLIGYIHIHDNNGIEDQHLGIGMGNISMKDVLLAIENEAPDAIWALEMYPEYFDSSINWLKKGGFIN